VSDAPDSGALAVFLITSHIFEVIGVAYALSAKHMRLGATGLNSAFASALMYHAQRAMLYNLDVPLNLLRLYDHISQQWLIGQLGLHLIMAMFTPARWQLLFQFFGYVVFFIGTASVLCRPYTAIPTLIMTIFIVIVLIIRIILLFAEGDLCGCAPDDNPQVTGDPNSEAGWRQTKWIWFNIVVAVVALAVGIFCFTFDSGDLEGNTVQDGVLHRYESVMQPPSSFFFCYYIESMFFIFSIWHMAAGIALWALTAAVSARLAETLRRMSMMRAYLLSKMKQNNASLVTL